MKGAVGGRGFLVTGPPDGDGRAIAVTAAARGEHVVYCESPGARTSVARPAGAVDLPGPSGRLTVLAADLSDENEVERVVDQALERLPNLDALVVVAATPPPTPLFEVSAAGWSSRVITPLREVLFLTRAVVGEFLASGRGGRIVLVSPLVAEQHPGQACAAAVQSGLRSFGRSVGKEYGGRGIACSIVLLFPDPSAPGGRTAAETVLFLASPEASYVNGACVQVGRCLAPPAPSAE